MAAPKNEDVKNKILDATESLLREKNFNDLSLAQVASKAEISKGTLYYYYKSKNDIFFDLTDRYLLRQWNDFLLWTEDEHKDTSITRLIKYVVERNVKNAALRLQLYGEAQLGNEELKEKLSKRYDEFEHLISEKIAQRTNLPADFLTWTILLISDGIIVQNAIGNKSFDSDAFITEAITHLTEMSELKKSNNIK